MKQLIRAVTAAFLVMLPALAAAQTGITLPANTVWGRTGIGPGPAQAIPFAQLSQFMFGTIPNNTVLGNVSGGSALTSSLTATQLTTLCNTFTSALKGCVPASGGGTVNFLRADGTFALPSATSLSYTPPGTGGVATTVKAELDRATTSVLDYGAVCDGVTNDATAIQNAYNAVKGTGRPLRIPVGTCLINSSLTFDTANSVVIGSSQNGSIIKVNSVAADGIVISAGNQIFSDFAVTSSIGGTRTGSGFHTTTSSIGIVFQRLFASGHKFGFQITSPALYFSDSVSASNNNYGVFYDNTTGGLNINESQLVNVQSNGNTAGGGFAFNCGTLNNGTGIFGYRLTAAANTGDGITIAGTAGQPCNDLFFTGLEMSFNTGSQVNATANGTGVSLSLSNAFIEGVNTASTCGVCSPMELTSISGSIITSSRDNILLNGSGNSISGVVSVGAAGSALRLGATSLHTSISGFQTSNVGGTNAVGMLIDVGAGSFVCGGSDFSQATTPRSGTVPAGSIITPCAGPL